MAKVDYVKINNTIKYIQNVAYLSELPVANENSADFVSVNNELYVKQVNGTTYTYAKVGGSGGLTVLEKTLDGELEIGAENLRFTEDFSLEDFDLLYNGQAIIRINNVFGEDMVSSLYLIPTQSAKVGENSNVACLLSYAGMMNIAVNLTLSGGALTYQIAITPIESGGSSQETIVADMSWFTSESTGVIPQEYRDIERLKNAKLVANIGDEYFEFRFVGYIGFYQFVSLTTYEFSFDLFRILIRPDSGWSFEFYKERYNGANELTVINLNDYVPSTATNGTLDSRELILLQASDSNYIVFNNEIFKLADKQHNEGYLVYSHNGHDTTGCFFQKCITITISTRGWVLEEQENQPKLTAGSGITIENNVISSTGGGGTTTDTAYVSNSTLYIEEGTTAGGGSSENIINATLTNELDVLYSSDIVGEYSFYKLPLTVEEIWNSAPIDGIALLDNTSGETLTTRPAGLWLFAVDMTLLGNVCKIYCPVFVYNQAMYLAFPANVFENLVGYNISIDTDIELPLTEVDYCILCAYGANDKLLCNDFKMYMSGFDSTVETPPLTLYSSSLDSSNLTTIYKLSITKNTILFTQTTQTGGGSGSNIQVVEVDSDTIDLIIG